MACGRPLENGTRPYVDLREIVDGLHHTHPRFIIVEFPLDQWAAASFHSTVPSQDPWRQLSGGYGQCANCESASSESLSLHLWEAPYGPRNSTPFRRRICLN